MTETSDQKCPVTGLEAEYDPFTEPQLSSPFSVWSAAREGCPVFRSDKLEAYVVTRFDDVVEVLGDHEQYSSVGASKGFSHLHEQARAVMAEVPPPSETDILPNDPPRHSKMRKFMQMSFLPRRIAGLEPAIRAIAEQLLDAMEGQEKVDFYREFAYPYPLQVVMSLVGLPEEDLPRIKYWVECNMAIKWGKLEPADQLAAAEGRRDFYLYLRAFIETRKAAGEDDFVSSLVTHSEQSDDPLTEAETVGQITSLLSAGHETTANFLTLILDTMLANPGTWESLVADPSLIPQAIEEGLRVNGPVQSLWRTTKADTVVAGETIPSGSRVSAVLSSANRDERMFEDPDTFDLSRANARKHISFGRGIHACVGSNLARMEIRVALELLTQRYPTLRRANDEPLTFSPSAVQRGPQELWLMLS